MKLHVLFSEYPVLKKLLYSSRLCVKMPSYWQSKKHRVKKKVLITVDIISET